MLLVTKPENVDAIRAVCDKWDLESAVIGRLTDDRTYRVKRHGKEVIALPVDLLADPPALQRPSAEPAESTAEFRLDDLPEPRDYAQVLRQLIASPNLCSRRWVYQQYDHYVGAATTVHPGADAAVVRVLGTDLQVAMTVDCNARYTLLDPYLGACLAVCEAARNLVAVGAEPLAISDCLNFGSPERPEIMWQFEQAIAGIRDACAAFETPVVSGNVSFYNETDGRGIPPTPTIAMVGLLRTPQPLTPWFKAEGDVIMLLGRTREEISGSEYAAVVHGNTQGLPPWVDLEAERRLQQVVLEAAGRDLLRSAHDLSEGGLAIALAECCFLAPEGIPALGARIRVDETMRADAFLFGESQARMLVSVRREHVATVRDLANEAGVAVAVLGDVGGGMLEFDGLASVSVAELRSVWDSALEKLVNG
jgi:phosphoribosylformylglycinamidine synthase